MVLRLIAAGILLVAAFVAAPGSPPPPRTLLVLGDSISAGYGIHVEEGWVALLQSRLQQQGYGYRVVNASVSGETTAGGLARLPRALELHHPKIVIIELGGNDGLRGLPLEEISKNLEAMIAASRSSGALVLLVGMRMPANYGATYVNGFQDIYKQLSKRLATPLVPFLLDGVALDSRLMQWDQIHPTAFAQRKLLDNVWPVLKSLLGTRRTADASGIRHEHPR